MNSLCIVRVHDDFTSIIDVQSQRKTITFSPPTIFHEPFEIAHYLKNKKKIYLLFTTDNSIEESITLPSLIKNEATLRTAILTKIQDDDRIHEKLILNKFYSSLDATGESATHRYEGLYEKEVLEAIAPIPHLEYLSRISITPFALFSVAESIFNTKSYLCVYAQETKNLIVAVSNGVLLFNRIGELQSTDEIERIMEQINDINRTVAYAHQQYREAKFEFIAICGSIAGSEIAPMQLQASTGLKITAIDPTLLVKGLETHTAQDYLLEIGMLTLQKSMNFLPDRVMAAREFHVGSFIAMAIAFLFMLLGLYQGLDAYNNYQESLDEYGRLQTQLTQTLRQTNTLDEAQLSEITAQLKSTTPLHHHFIDDMIIFDPLLKLLKPSSLSFEENQGKGKVVINFKQEFKTLLELYLFEKEFKKIVTSLKPPSSTITPTYKSDYNLLSFEATLSMGESEKAPLPRRRGRR